MSEETVTIAGQLDLDEVLALVSCDDGAPAPAAVRGGSSRRPTSSSTRSARRSSRARRRSARMRGRAGASRAGSGPLPTPADLTAANVARYHAHLVAGGRSSATVKKDRAALNTFLRWLAQHEHVPAGQVRAALAVRLSRAERSERETPTALSAAQYERLVRAAKARIADDPLAGARDLAIVLVLGDAGLRCQELAGRERRDFLPARKGAQLRGLTSGTARAIASGACG